MPNIPKNYTNIECNEQQDCKVNYSLQQYLERKDSDTESESLSTNSSNNACRINIEQTLDTEQSEEKFNYTINYKRFAKSNCISIFLIGSIITLVALITGIVIYKSQT